MTLKLTVPFSLITPGVLCLALVLGLLTGCGQSLSVSASPSGELERAKRLIDQGNYEAALLELNQALLKAPQDPHVHANLGWLYLYTGNLPQAEKELRKVTELAPDLAETFHLQGSLHSQQAQQTEDESEAKRLHTSAIESFRQAIHMDPQKHQVYYDLANSLITVQQPESALEALDNGFEMVPPNDLESLVNFQVAACSAHAEMGMYEEAIIECKHALEFATSEESRSRIDGMINNMALINPEAAQKAEQFQGTTKLTERLGTSPAEEQAILEEAAAD